MTQNAIYDAIGFEYQDLVGPDPSKQFVQFPWAIDQLPMSLEGMTVLDAGCGEGSLSRILANKGARVLGYDNSITQIEKAKEIERLNPLGIEYLVAEATNICELASNYKSDSAVSICVLHYALNVEHLKTFFSSTYQLTKAGGSFSALFFNPDFQRFDQKIYNRRYTRESSGQLLVEFFDDRKTSFSAQFSEFTRTQYEDAATASGWIDLSWTPVRVTKEGRKQGGEFWDNFEEDCPYAGLKMKKPD